MSSFTSLTDETQIALNTLFDRANSLLNPSFRLGVTGLSHAGKTVFITALVQNLIHGGRLPMLTAAREGRITSVELQHQPDDAIQRFEYEKHLSTIVNERIWPQSTRALSQLRLTVRFIPKSAVNKTFSRGKINIDLIDYPGEWLLDLPLLNKTYREFSQESIMRAQHAHHRDYAKDWLGEIQSINILAEATEPEIENLATSFKDYLISAKKNNVGLSMLPPGRFLMPGEFEGTPLLTFCPLPHLTDKAFPPKSLAAVMERRYESYKKYVIKPFFREHIARLDRQIILVDALRSLNADAYAVNDLEHSLAEILSCFRAGRNSWAQKLWQHRIGRILVASTKADHLHHENHDLLQNLTQQIVAKAIAQAGINGAKTDSLAMASIRSTREGSVVQSGETLPVIIGTPMKGETIDNQIYDGETEAAIFPGDLPENLDDFTKNSKHQNLNFIRFRPPLINNAATLPHIRLDRAIEFLIGDYLQ